MKKEFKPLSWLVKCFDCIKQVIEDYDILKYREDDIKKMKKKCNTKEEFAKLLNREMMWRFWSKSEHELIIRLTDDDRVILRPWCGCRNEDEAEICVENDVTFNWKGFARYHIDKQVYKNEAKIDIYNQLQWQWQDFVDYVWNYHHKWQRRKKDEI